MRRDRVTGCQATCAAPDLRRRRLGLAWLAAMLCAGPAFAGVNLITVNPAAGPTGTTVAIGGGGFPSGAIPAGNVTVTITPSGGPPVTIPAGAVLGTGPARLVMFIIPEALASGSPTVCRLAVAGSSGSNEAFTTSAQASLLVQPAASVASVAPGAAQAGAGVTLRITGANTHFTSHTVVTLALGQSSIRQSGAATLEDATHVTATFQIPAGAAAGAYAVTATTGTESAALAGGLAITDAAPLALASVAPSWLAAGQGATVNVTGVGTHFVQGTTVAGFGDGATAGPVTVVDATHASIPIAVDPLASPGARTLTLNTGGELASGAFGVTSSGAALTSVGRALPAPACASGCFGPQGTAATLTLTGTGTHWAQGLTTVSVGGGIGVAGVVVNSPASLTASISIGLGVPVGRYAVTVVTGGEIVTLTEAFGVTAAGPHLSWVYPNTGAQGQTLNVAFTGVSTSFDAGSLSAAFGANVTVNSITAGAACSVTANITISWAAAAGSRNATLTSNGTDFGFTFTVAPSGAAVVGATPTAPGVVHQSDAGDLISVVGSGTHFAAEGLNSSIAFCAGVTVTAAQVIDATHIVAAIGVSASAPVGPCGVTVTTGGEVASGQNLFNIEAGAVDRTPESVVQVSPANHQQGVPLNARISLRLARPALPASVNNSSVTLTPAVSGATVGLSADRMTVTIALGSSLLAAGTAYAVNVPAGGFQDQNGNPVAAFASRFDTGAAADSAAGAITLSHPVAGEQGVAVTQAITVAFSEPWDANSLTGDYFKVCRNQDCSNRIPGAMLPAVNNTMVFTPSGALPVDTRIDVYAGVDSAILDLAGNRFAPLSAYFVTGEAGGLMAFAADAAALRVISVTPPNGAAGVGRHAPIAIRFNRPLDVETINQASFALYNGPDAVGISPSYSSDRTVVYLSAPGHQMTLPYGAEVTVAISTAVRDYGGGGMAGRCGAPLDSDCAYRFSTETRPAAARPTVIQARPGDGAAADVPITLYMSAPMNLTSVQASMFVTQNGTPVAGIASLTAEDRGIVWMPSAGAFEDGALIEIRVRAPAADSGGNAVTDYCGSYRTRTAAGASSGFVETALVPCRGCVTSLRNPVVEARFSNSVDQATVVGSTVYVTGEDGVPISGSISFPSGDVIRFTPSAPLEPGALYRSHFASGIRDVFGNALAGDVSAGFRAGAALDTTAPSLQFATPWNGAAGVGVNAPIRLVFSKKMDTLSINSNTIGLRAGAALPYTVTFGCIECGGALEQTVATLLPQSPLPESAAVLVILTNGVTDLSGNALAAETITFHTGAGADFNAPSVAERSIRDGNNGGIPVNSTFTVGFSKPLDPHSASSANGAFAILMDTAGWIATNPPSVSSDGRSVTIAPAANLPGGAGGSYYWCGATDLNGNAAGCGSQDFTTSSLADVTPPAVVSTNPVGGGAAAVSANPAIEIAFSEPVRAASLGAIALSGPEGVVPIRVSVNHGLNTDGSVVRVFPRGPLQPNTAYTVMVRGVEDVAGNAMAGAFGFGFTTGFTTH
jgi:hypothetical protein